MTDFTSNEYRYFTPFNEEADLIQMPLRFTYPFDYEPHPLSLIAVAQLQLHLKNQQEWEHNFGLEKEQQGAIIGKMFGVLVVKTAQNELGFLAAYSGKLAGGNQHNLFVPPIFDSLTEGSFLNIGMTELTLINQEIELLSERRTSESMERIESLKEKRRKNSISLQEKLFDNYHFLNQAGESKSLRDIFYSSLNSSPPSGAGECAAPKLLQFAFQHNMKPISMAEFWWGQSPKSDFWQHGNFYPACSEKCRPILTHMLQGIELDNSPS